MFKAIKQGVYTSAHTPFTALHCCFPKFFLCFNFSLHAVLHTSLIYVFNFAHLTCLGFIFRFPYCSYQLNADSLQLIRLV